MSWPNLGPSVFRESLPNLRCLLKPSAHHRPSVTGQAGHRNRSCRCQESASSHLLFALESTLLRLLRQRLDVSWIFGEHQLLTSFLSSSPLDCGQTVIAVSRLFPFPVLLFVAAAVKRPLLSKMHQTPIFSGLGKVATSDPKFNQT